MMNKHRHFAISTKYTLTELAQQLSTHSWCLCNGFLAEGLLLLNDAFSEDGAQEFAVFSCPFSLAELEAEPRTLNQIESLTCSWMKESELRAELYALAGKTTPKPAGVAASKSPVVVATSVAQLKAALQEGTPKAPRTIATHPIKTHSRDEYCHYCA